MRSLLLPLVCLTMSWSSYAQRPMEDLALVRERLLQQGYHPDDLAGLEVRDSYLTAHNGVSHTFIRQRWQGIEVYNGDIGIHRTVDGGVVQMNNGSWAHLAKRVNTTAPVLTASEALTLVLARTLPGVPPPGLVSEADGKWTFDGSLLGGEPAHAFLVYQPVGGMLRLAWNVDHYTPDGTHWWNIRIDALTGEELDRNDWVSQCDFGPGPESDHLHGHFEASGAGMAAPAAPNDYNVYPWPTESPSHGTRQIRNAPWLDGGIASPYGWHDTNGATGAEYTTTRGNNVWAKEDLAADNETTAGFAPSGGSGLDFDFPINLANAPSTNQSPVITNLFYWNNVIHDVWYGYGFDEPSGNFQQNNYGRGGTGSDYVLADALDGSGTNNANFGTPADGARPRMQMYVWTSTAPNRTSDLDNGIIAHEYAHGVSNRLLGGPSNVNCLGNAEQMGEGWSDFFSLIMTIKAGDVGTTGRGIGTYVLGQATTGPGIRPARYSTAFGVNGYTYGATNNASISQPHGIGFIWCTMLWELTWELIGVYGLDPDIYNGTGGNNLAMQLVIDGMKLTPCNPGFVDARNAILQADQINNGGANQASIWAAFARRGLGFSASQGSSANRSDQVEAFDLPLPNNVGIASVSSPQPGQLLNCANNPITVTAVVRNFGTQPQSNFPVRYQLDGGAFIAQNFTGTLAPNTSAVFTFTQQVAISGLGAHTLSVSTNLSGDQYAGDNQVNVTLTVINATTINAPMFEGLSVASPTPTGWRIENPDNATTWSTTLLTNGTQCVSSRAWSIDHYNYNGAGQEDRLITPLIDLTYMTASRLRFSHAYARYSSSYFEGFRVDVSGNCGASWTTVFNASGSALATAPDATAAWQPSNCSQWYDHDINIGAYDGQQILVRFVTICGYGNFFYLDEVEVTGISSPLPVELVSLQATTATEGIRVDWSTASEQNSERYDVQQSTDLERWTTIGSVPAAGASFNLLSYTLLDRMPVPGLNYYRLFMLDADGTSELSGVVSAPWSLVPGDPWPNPNNGTFQVYVDDPSTPVTVFNAQGEIVAVRRLTVGDHLLELVLEDAAAGVYQVRMGAGRALRSARIVVTPR